MEKKEIYKEEMEKIRADPYNYIMAFYENEFPKTGGKVMSICSLMPCSLIIPSISHQSGKKVPSNIHVLLLSNPGTAKTSLGEHFSKFTYEPFPFEFITDAKLAK